MQNYKKPEKIDAKIGQLLYLFLLCTTAHKPWLGIVVIVVGRFQQHGLIMGNRLPTWEIFEPSLVQYSIG
ncbi:hypothetical protein T07_13399 [Trichinella nelsoni]|uniref:Uncharacterized protein n=1 Tax=Trichinella nelsoni TaxID=6336 RepID=A0A0V0S6S3_9BILA|nr:hypothetical protein T07_13399 [Trichinella nelsoni]